MTSPGTSLLTFLDAPVVVGDPHGRVAYVNPAFETAFSVDEDSARGVPLAELFDGGAREGVLGAVARVCERGETERLRLRQAGVGYSALVSPIVAEDSRVGVVILFTVQPLADERLVALQRELCEPLDEVARALDTLFAETGGRRDEHHRSLVEDGLRNVGRIQKLAEELGSLLAGEAPCAPTKQRCDPARALRAAAARGRAACVAAGVELEVLVPAQLPETRGDADRLESALVRLIEASIAAGSGAAPLTLAARVLERARSVLLTVVESPESDEALPDPDPTELAQVRAVAASLGGDLLSVADPVLGRAHAIRLDLA